MVRGLPGAVADVLRRLAPGLTTDRGTVHRASGWTPVRPSPAPHLPAKEAGIQVTKPEFTPRRSGLLLELPDSARHSSTI